MSTRWRNVLRSPLLLGMAYGLLLRIAFYWSITQPYLGDVMGFAFAFGAPFAVGAITVFTRAPALRSWNNAASGAFLAVTLFVLGTGLLLLEGLICIAMALPLFWIAGTLGAWAAMLVVKVHDRSRLNVSVIAILPVLASMFEPAQTLPLTPIRQEIQREAVLDAPAAAVWAQITTGSELKDEYFDASVAARIGMPTPLSGQIRKRADGQLIRRSFWGKKVYFDEPITALEPQRYLAWRYQFYPDSFPPGAMDEHVVIGGRYFNLTDTDFRLTPLPDGRTRVRMRIGFTVDTAFNWYSRPMANWVLSNFAETALDALGAAANANPASPGA